LLTDLSFPGIQMTSMTTLQRAGLVACVLTAFTGLRAHAADEFPFGFEITLDSSRMPGSKRIPSLDIGDAGETRVDLWCKSGRGQFSVAGDTVIFVAGALQDQGCTPERAQADDDLVAALNAVTNWKRQGDAVSLIGPNSLRFRINTN
jgi:hypothetical protein